MNRSDKKQATKQRILLSAKQLFKEQGFEATSTRQIAKHAQVAVGTVFSHFSDKFELTKALFFEELELLLQKDSKQLEQVMASPLGKKSPALAAFGHQCQTLYQYYHQDRELSKSFLQNAMFDLEMFDQQMQGFLAGVSTQLKIELNHLNDKQCLILAKAWFGFYFFELLAGISDRQSTPEQWLEKLMPQCEMLYDLQVPK